MRKYKKHKERKLDKRSQLVGKYFNDIKCLKLLDKMKWKAKVFLFKCHCGKEFEECGYIIKNGHKKSCGCLFDSVKFKPGRVTNRKDQMRFLKYKYTECKCSSKRKTRTLEFELSFHDFCEIVKKNCIYCDAPPVVGVINKGYTYSYEGYSNGVDRINNDIGYTKENSAPCCTTCNMMKKALNIQIFIDHCKKIAEFQNKKSGEIHETYIIYSSDN